MWKKALENAKLIAGSIMVFAALIAGTWTLITDVFITRAEANEIQAQQQIIIKKLDLDTSYNKAFRLETRIKKYKKKEKEGDIDDFEKRMLKRLEKDLNRTEQRIDILEQKIYDVQ